MPSGAIDVAAMRDADDFHHNLFVDGASRDPVRAAHDLVLALEEALSGAPARHGFSVSGP